MKKKNMGPTIVSLVLVLLSASALGQPVGETQRPDALQVATQEKVYVLSVPVSRLVLFIPRGKLVRTEAHFGGAANHPRYFHFVDRAFNVSGWIEPAQKYSGMQKFWESETQGWKRTGQPDPINVEFKKIEGWDAAIYDMADALGNNSHIRAHWLQAGTWIDIHLSMTSSRPHADIRSVLEGFLKATYVKERGQ